MSLNWVLPQLSGLSCKTCLPAGQQSRFGPPVVLSRIRHLPSVILIRRSRHCTSSKNAICRTLQLPEATVTILSIFCAAKINELFCGKLTAIQKTLDVSGSLEKLKQSQRQPINFEKNSNNHCRIRACLCYCKNKKIESISAAQDDD